MRYPKSETRIAYPVTASHPTKDGSLVKDANGNKIAVTWTDGDAERIAAGLNAVEGVATITLIEAPQSVRGLRATIAERDATIATLRTTLADCQRLLGVLNAPGTHDPIEAALCKSHTALETSKPKPNLYCYDEAGKDAHAVKLRVSPEDRERFRRQPRSTERFIRVTDLDTGKVWRVRPADCGLGCRCAALAIEVKGSK